MDPCKHWHALTKLMSYGVQQRRIATLRTPYGVRQSLRSTGILTNQRRVARIEERLLDFESRNSYLARMLALDCTSQNGWMLVHDTAMHVFIMYLCGP